MTEITQQLLGGEQDEYMGIDFHTKDMRERAKNLSQINQKVPSSFIAQSACCSSCALQ